MMVGSPDCTNEREYYCLGGIHIHFHDGIVCDANLFGTLVQIATREAPNPSEYIFKTNKKKKRLILHFIQNERLSVIQKNRFLLYWK